MNSNKDLQNMLCFQISRTHQLYNKFYQDPLKQFHLTYVQYVTLLSLWGQDGVTVNHLSAELGLTNGTLTPLLKRLALAGWIVRKRDKRDERRVLISLTDYGRSMENKVQDGIDQCFVELNIPDDEYQTIMTMINDLQGRLKNYITNQYKETK